MSNITISHSGQSISATKFIGHSRNFEITIDQRPSLGGNDDAAAPIEYTLASLAGCLNIVAHIVAKELNIELKSLKISVNGTINPNKFLTGNSPQRVGFTDVEVKFDVDSDADQKLLNKWLEIVEQRCPVSDNLINQTPVQFIV